MKSKVFLLNRQKTGTTSIGDFFQDHGFERAGWDDVRTPEWTSMWYDGNYKGVLEDAQFLQSEMFEDWPWFHGSVPKIISDNYPDARFILVFRDPDDWFDSLRKHVSRKGQLKIRQHNIEYFDDVALSGGEIDLAQRSKYQKVYLEHIGSVISYFNSKPHLNFYFSTWKNESLFEELAEFVGVDYNGKKYHSNAAPAKEKRFGKTKFLSLRK